MIIYDIHALQNRFYFSDNVLPLPVSAVPLFLNQLFTAHSNEKVAICFPDDGAAKRYFVQNFVSFDWFFGRFGKLFKDYDVVVCAKVRQGNKRIVTIKDVSLTS